MMPAGASARCCSTGCPSRRSEARTATRSIRCDASDLLGLYPSPWRLRRPGKHACLVPGSRIVVSAASAESRTLRTKAETQECRVACVEGNLAYQMRIAAVVAELLTAIFFEVEVPSWKEKEDSLHKSFARWWYRKQMELLIFVSMCFDGLQNRHALIIAAPANGSARTPSSAARDGSKDAGGGSGGGPGRGESGGSFGKQEGACVVGTADVSLIRVDSLLRKHLKCSKGETCALLTNMGVLERYRGHGVGSQLVQTAEAAALDLSPTPCMMMLYVYKDNTKGISLYKSHGFSETDWLDPDWAAAADRSRPGAPRRLLMAKPLPPAS